MGLSKSRVICWIYWTLFLLECSRPTVSTTVTDCPMRFPYAYFNGKYCCLFNKEKTAYQYRGAYDDALCDGANMTIASECCLHDQYIKCPGTTCQSLSYEITPCPQEFPYAYYNGYYCCKVGLEKGSFSKNTLGSGCNGGAIARESLCCQSDQFIECTDPPCATMDWWSLTWYAEGNENPSDADYSRKLRVPTTAGYGVTLGRGYDMQFVFPSDIYGDLLKVGVSEANAQLLSQASTLNTTAGRKFITDNNLENFTITKRQEWELFKIIRDSKIQAAKMILSDTYSAFGTINFDTLQSSVKGTVIDLFFRMQYFSNYATLQPEVVKNNPAALRTIVNDKAKWGAVSDDRFNRRKAYMDKAVG